MEFHLLLTVACPDCDTWYEPDVRPVAPVKDPQVGRERDWCFVVRFTPKCPACNAVGSMLRRAGLKGVAGDFE
jgi:hypothetical protein